MLHLHLHTKTLTLPSVSTCAKRTTRCPDYMQSGFARPASHLRDQSKKRKPVKAGCERETEGRRKEVRKGREAGTEGGRHGGRV